MFAAVISALAPPVPSASTGALPRIRVNTATHFFIDDAGSAVVFHGVNTVEKLHPFLPVRHGFTIERSLSDGDAANLASWGFNVVRLGVLWAGTMPEPGHINQTYLEEAREIVRMLGRHGVYTLIDMHQDSMGARFCGEGFPDWAVRKALRLSGFNSSAPFHRPHLFLGTWASIQRRARGLLDLVLYAGGDRGARGLLPSARDACGLWRPLGRRRQHLHQREFGARL